MVLETVGPETQFQLCLFTQIVILEDGRPVSAVSVYTDSGFGAGHPRDTVSSVSVYTDCGLEAG